MYCKSPPLTRANLNRSQSVYTKSQTAINRDIAARPGPLVPAQSLYPLRVSQQQQNPHLQNQNVQNQMQQRSESIYGIRSSMRQPNSTSERIQQQIQQAQPPQMHPQSIPQSDNPGFQPIYGSRANPNTSIDELKYERQPRESRDESMNFNRPNRPESMYGVSGRRIQSAQSDDSSYGSYHGSNALTPPARNASNSSSNYPQQNGGLVMPNYGGPNPGQSHQERKMSSSSQPVSNRGTEYSQKPPLPMSSSNGPPNMQHQTYGMLPLRQN